MTDPDTDLDAWHDGQQPGLLTVDPGHECPADMPPCPECEARIEEQEWNEFGTH